MDSGRCTMIAPSRIVGLAFGTAIIVAIGFAASLAAAWMIGLVHF
jgi:hypothetical protein